MDMVLFHSIWTVLLLILFIGIWAWAWSKNRKGAFDAAARQLFDDDELKGSNGVAGRTMPGATKDLNLPTHRGEKNHG
jgi:cytochrome c oxidase cbb3-type subunit 4